jgi:hypothetical protein
MKMQWGEDMARSSFGDAEAEDIRRKNKHLPKGQETTG